MIDIVYPLRKKYFEALSTTNYPVYYQFAPDDEGSKVYIVFGGIEAGQADTKSSEDSDVRVRVTIHTWDDKYNEAITVDTAAGLVYTAMATKFDLSADGFQNISQKRDTDNVVDYGTMQNKIYIDRIITFKHKIFIQ